jgi:hypothetical protein
MNLYRVHEEGVWVVLSIALVLLTASVCQSAERAYYSIQLASFRNLENANRQVVKAAPGEKHIFWMQVEIPDKGIFYRVYLGRFPNREEALTYANRLKESGILDVTIIHRFVDQIPDIDEKPENSANVSKTIDPALRFRDNGDGTVTDSSTGLMWAKSGWMFDFFMATDWWVARDKVKQLRLAGHMDWRLPTLEEWKELIDPRHQYPAMVEPNPFVNIITHMPYWTSTPYSYTPGFTSKPESPGHAYTVMLYSGNVQHQNKKEHGFVLPVRNIR